MEGLHRLHPLLRSFVANGPAGCALSVTHHGETVFEDYAGLADIETKKDVSRDTIYRIYSMTKIVTCTAALMLYERGFFLLNDPLEAYLPEFARPQVFESDENDRIDASPSSRSIRIKDLFTMTSGLSYGGNSDEAERQSQRALESLAAHEGTLSTRDFSKILAPIPLAFEPGTQWRYSLSHDILGALIEVLSGKTLGQFFKEEIFEPLHMYDTFFQLPENKKDRLCSLYTRNEQGEMIKNTELDKRYDPNTSFESGGGGLLSSLSDYSRFAHMLANNGEWNGARILGRKTIELMATNHLDRDQLTHFNWPYLSGYGYGLGIRVMMNPALGGINSSIGEFGWSGLAGTWTLIDRKEKLSVVYMQQMMPNLEAYHQPRLRNVIYGALR